MPADDSEAVLAAHRAWLDSLNAMLEGDPAPFAEIYSHSDDVSYMSAEGGLRIGWAASWQDWQAQAKLAQGGHVEEIERHIIIHENTAVVQCVERALIKNAEGVAVEQQGRETSVFRREAGKWKMVAHHADALRDWVKVAGAARNA